MLAANSVSLLIAFLSPQVVRWTVWTGLVALTVALLVLMRTQWGQSNPLRKCIVLSLVVHLLVGIYATTVHIVTGGGSGGGDGQGIAVSVVDDVDGETSVAAVEATTVPWSEFSNETSDELLHAPLDASPPVDTALADVSDPPTIEPAGVGAIRPPATRDEFASVEANRDEQRTQRERQDQATRSASDIPPPEPNVDSIAADVAPPESAEPSDQHAATNLANLPTHDEPGDEGPNDRNETPPSEMADVGGRGRSNTTQTGGQAHSTAVTPHSRRTYQTPREYQNRGGDRLQIALGNGGSIDTERAVAAALAWLAKHQASDGHWRSGMHGGGAATNASVGDEALRISGAGSHADVGVTGLALLAFLASGCTHESGDYRNSVADAIGCLVDHQASNGLLAQDAGRYERMYCHAMATFALSEALGMTGDERLKQPVQRAIAYSIAAQHSDGSWRYAPGEPGDTSQLGWQLMALKSADLAGLPLPENARQGMIRYLNQVARGRAGGLACYRQGREPTATMTAEALVCRQFLGLEFDSPAAHEAADYLLQELPGAGPTNVYYWYYGTLALYRMQGPKWDRWNLAMQKAVLTSQRTAGDLKGSWDPDATWGQYGGRVFNTALACLCLEVYYRYLPVQVEAARAPATADRARNR